MKQPLFFPFYHIHADIVKSSLGLKDSRSVEKFFSQAGIKVFDIGGKKCVMCEDLLAATKPKPQIFHYDGKGRYSQEIDDLD